VTECDAVQASQSEEWDADLTVRVGEDPKPRILVVDDFAIERRIAGRLVEGAGFEPLYAANGEEALRLTEEKQPVAILTDMQMPGMGGLELVEHIRRRHPRIPVIVMTAFGSEQIAIQALRAGASNYVPKRDLARDLPETLRRQLELATADRHRRQLIGCLQGRTAQFELGNDPQLFAPLIDLLLEDLERIQFGDGTARIRMGVALQEALANALYHGNLEVSSELRQEDERHFHELAQLRRHQSPYMERRIRVTAVMDIETARFEITDQGPGFDTSIVDRPIEPEDLLRVGGRGLLLIRTFMDVAWHNPRGSKLTRVKFSAQPAGSGG
jgi:CheY-like chemotaxis protein